MLLIPRLPHDAARRMEIDRTSYQSPNHHPRDQAVSALVLHTGEGTRHSDLATLTKPDPLRPVSCHYYVCRDSTVYQLINDNQVAYHAGASHYAGLSGWNDFSLGIETEHKKGQDWPAKQWGALRELCHLLVERYQIKLDRRVAHRWIAPTRKTDPSDKSDDELYWFFSALGHATAQPWRPYRVVVPAARVRSIPAASGPIARTLARGMVFWGTEVRGAKVSGDPIWAARRYGGYVHASLLSVARDLEPV